MQVNLDKSEELLNAFAVLVFVVPELLDDRYPNEETLARIHRARQVFFLDATRGGAHGIV